MSYRPSISRTLLAALLLCSPVLSTNAQTTGSTSDVPRTISYQGMITSSDKAPVADGQYQITVALYSDEAGSARVWQDTYTTSVNGGLFNLYLGSGTKALPPSIVMNTPLWIGTSLNGESEMRPLTPLSASPYALNVPDGVITANKLADQSVTAAKLDVDYVSGLQVNGEQVTGKGTVLNIQGTPSIPLSYDPETQSLTIGKANTAGQRGDNEKGASTLVGGPTLWSVGGDGYTLPVGSGIGYNPIIGDWIGTTAASGVDFLIGVNAVQIMDYQVSGGTVMNIVGGDAANTITAATSSGSIIAQGFAQSISNGDYNTISGGQSNSIDDGNHHTIGGGDMNTIGVPGGPATHHSTIGGGWDNNTTSSESVIAGGHNNSVDSYAASVVGGHDNIIPTNSRFAFIGGGQSNRAEADHATIGGGTNNNVGPAATMGTIGGGGDNRVLQSEATIAGGHNNSVDAYVAGITSGHDNIIGNGGDASFIGAGRANNISSLSSVIGGGENNTISFNKDYSVIGGGMTNNINATFGFIGGGEANTIDAEFGVIGGGQQNYIGGSHTTIPGGDRLVTAASYGQSAMGFFNAPRGSMPVTPTAAQVAASNDPLFMLGNGDIIAGATSNAFEVSYNGHSSVYGINGSGTVNPSITGGTFVDNVLYAWADVPAAGGIGPVIPNSDFGVASITNVGAGVYDVVITVTDQTTSSVVTLNDASITATVVDDAAGTNRCASITTTRIGAIGVNAFRIRTYLGGCKPADLPFMFKVTGRP